jgi:hypothetical protein
LILVLAALRRYVSRNRVIDTGPTWGCGYSPSVIKFQYTAGSFVRSYSKLAKPLLDIEKQDVEISEVFPSEKHYETEPYDKIERIFIDKPLRLIYRTTDQFLFLQNGHLQRYILYGIIFITSVICVPLIIEKLMSVIHFLNNL